MSYSDGYAGRRESDVLPTCKHCGRPVYYGTDGTKYDGGGPGFKVHECRHQPTNEDEMMDTVPVDEELLVWLVDCAKLVGRMARVGHEYREKIERAEHLIRRPDGTVPTTTERGGAR